MVIFKRVSVEGYGSFRNATDFKLDRGSINMIKGNNGNGKTTLFSALSWALYKVNLKGLNNEKVQTWERLRGDNYRGTRVIVEFSVPNTGFDYLIARHINFTGTTKSIKGKSTLMIFRKTLEEPAFTKDHLLGDEQYKGDQQLFINRTIGLDSKTFLNSVLFGQKMKRLIEAPADDKRKLFETLFDLDFIQNAKDVADLKLKEETEVLNKILAEIEKDEAQISLLNSQLTTNKQIISDFENNKKETLQNYKAELTELMAELANISKEIEVAGESIASFDFIELENILLEVSKLTLKSTELKAEFDKVVANEKEKFELNYTDAIDFQRGIKRTNEQSVDEDRSKLQELETTLTSQKNALQDYVADLKRTAIKDLETEETELKFKRGTAIVAEEKSRTYYNQLTKSINQYDASYLEHTEKIDKLKIDIDNVKTCCPSCNQDLPKESISTVKKNIKLEIKKEEEAVVVIDTETKKLKQKLIEAEKDLDKKSEELVDLNYLCKEISTKIEQTVANFSYLQDSGYLDKMADMVIIEKAITDAKQIIAQKSEQIKEITDKIVTLETSKKEKLKTHLENNEAILKIGKDYEDNAVALNILVEDKLILEGKSNSASEAKKLLPVLQEREKGKKDSITRVEKSITDEETKKAPDVDIKTIENNLFRLTTKVSLAQDTKEKSDLKIADLSWWSKTGFGAGGLKAFVFNSGLVLLNKACEKYAARLGVRLEFSVDLTKSSKPFLTKCFKGDIEIDYEELSGGQQARLNVATAFAMHDLISSTANINMLILDEIFENLDPSGIESIFDLIRTKAGDNRSVYVVTHTPSIDALNTKTIEIEFGEDEISYIC